jgi:hypothetical protein
MSTKTHRRPATVATLTLLGGIAASLSGNLQAINLDNHQPGIGAYISAIVWPMTLLAVVEVLIHTPWLRTWRDGLTKAAAVGLVGAMAAYISYFHLAHTLSAYGYDVASRYAGPLAIDAAMVMATLALNRVGHARRALATVQAVQAEPVQTPGFPDKAAMAEAEPVQEMATEDWDNPVLDIRPVESVADEAQHYLDRVARDLDPSTTPATPVQAVRFSSNEVRPDSVPADAQAYLGAWMLTDASDRPSPGQVDTLLASEFGVQPRTVRRWRTATLSA